MLLAFVAQNGRLLPLDDEEIDARLGEAMWIDLIEPSDDERAKVEALYLQPLPEAEDVEEIEASARSYEDRSGLHINGLFLHEVEGRARNSSVLFTLSGDRLFTLREREIPAFRLLRMRAKRDPAVGSSAASLLLTLFEIKIEDLADTLEEVYTGLEGVGTTVLDKSNVALEKAIDELAHLEDINGKVRLCLMDAQRGLTFLLRRGRLDGPSTDRVRELLRDIDSLLPHNSFLFEKVNFLMVATQGFINIQQNQIIKIFSVVAVVFLPPTLIASVYGMNFSHMPELHWIAGYPWALLLILISAISPYWYFKRKGWL
jgi:magnesium transporter